MTEEAVFESVDSAVRALRLPAIAEGNALLNPTKLWKPAFCLNVPFSFSTAVPNNAWMDDYPNAEERSVNQDRALTQFLNLYNFLASEALVTLLPTPRNCALQDLVFTANLGAVLDHLPDRNTVVLSNFSSQPRCGEDLVGRAFFEQMGYDVVQSPYKFEGEAELKHLYDNVYVGGYGIRSDRETYDWMERTFGITVIPLRETNRYLYHLDCSLFPLTRSEVLMCTSLYSADEVRSVEKYASIIDVSLDEAMFGICNSVRLWGSILNASNIHDLKKSDEYYEGEKMKNDKLERIAAKRAFEVSFFNLSEYLKGGALLSCLVLHLNRYSYALPLIL